MSLRGSLVVNGATSPILGAGQRVRPCAEATCMMYADNLSPCSDGNQPGPAVFPWKISQRARRNERAPHPPVGDLAARGGNAPRLGLESGAHVRSDLHKWLSMIAVTEEHRTAIAHARHEEAMTSQQHGQGARAALVEAVLVVEWHQMLGERARSCARKQEKWGSCLVI